MDPKIIELQNENSTLTLKLTASNTELGTIKAQLTAKDAELTALKSKLEEHETKSIEELVNTTIAVHAKDMGLTEKHKSHLLRFAKADPEGFRGMYPVVPAAQQYLAKSVATGGRDDDASVVKTDPNAPPAADMSDIPTIAELVPKLMAKARDEGVELSFEQAHVKAHEKIVKLVGKSARKALAPTGT